MATIIKFSGGEQLTVNESSKAIASEFERDAEISGQGYGPVKPIRLSDAQHRGDTLYVNPQRVSYWREHRI
jgi:hypothetical protein